MLCCSGPPLPETLKLLAPLANLEVLSLRNNGLGGTIAADVSVFTKLKTLDLANIFLAGKPLSIRTERSKLGDFVVDFQNVPRFQAASHKSS